MTAWNSFSYICTRALHSFLSFAYCHVPFSVIPLLPNVTITLSIQPKLGLPRPRPLPSTPLWPFGTHPVFPHTQTISILSDLLHSRTPVRFQLILWASSFLTLSIRDTPTKLLKTFVSHSISLWNDLGDSEFAGVGLSGLSCSFPFCRPLFSLSLHSFCGLSFGGWGFWTHRVRKPQ